MILILQLFKEVRTIWAEIDSIQLQAQKKANMESADNSEATSAQISKLSEASVESQPISYSDQMSSNLS